MPGLSVFVYPLMACQSSQKATTCFHFRDYLSFTSTLGRMLQSGILTV